MQPSRSIRAPDMTTPIEAPRSVRAPDTAIPRIAIVGAGFTGTLLAMHLLREAKAPLAIHLIEQHGWFGRGVAYSTGNPSHLLNTRVANMSAFPDEPADFLLWLWRFDYEVDGLPIPPSGHAFVPRGVYGTYLEDTLIAACKAAAPGVECHLRAVEATGVRRGDDRHLLSFRGDAPAAFDRIALCIGNLPPRLPCEAVQLDRPRYIADPWHEPELADIPAEAPVAILGTGLTAVDVVFARSGAQGTDHGFVSSRSPPPAPRDPSVSRLHGGRTGAGKPVETLCSPAHRGPQGRGERLCLAQRHRCVSPA